MGYKHFINSVETAKKIMDYYIKKGHIVLDCTVGNGNDTLFLAKLVGETGKVYGFDIQSTALDITKDKLLKEGLEDRVTLINDTHENIDKYIIKKIDLVVYNLGYLPSGDKKIRTKGITTLESIKKALVLLNKNGILLVTSYTGHKGGLEEKNLLEDFLTSLNQKQYNILKFNFINQQNNPPILYGVEKLLT